MQDIFSYEDNQVRTAVDSNGDLWFAASDVCQCLGIGNVTDAVSRREFRYYRNSRRETAHAGDQRVRPLQSGVEKPKA